MNLLYDNMMRSTLSKINTLPVLNNFITLEGMDGCGKSTVIKALVGHLEQKGFEVIVTREPGGTPLGEKLRDIVKFEEMDNATEIALMNAIRIEHLQKVIIPAINQGKFVICDRYIDSTFIYQALAQDENKIEKLQKIIEMAKVFNIALPEKTILLDVPVETSLKRRDGRNEAIDKFEQKTIEQLTLIRNGYLDLSQVCDNRFIKVNADQELSQVIKEALVKFDEDFLSVKKNLNNKIDEAIKKQKNNNDNELLKLNSSFNKFKKQSI